MQGMEYQPQTVGFNEATAAVQDSWLKVIDTLREATIEVLPDLSDEDKLGLAENFWPTHIAIMQREGPEVTKTIFDRSDEIKTEKMALEQTQATQTTMKKIGSFVKDFITGK